MLNFHAILPVAVGKRKLEDHSVESRDDDMEDLTPLREKVKL